MPLHIITLRSITLSITLNMVAMRILTPRITMLSIKSLSVLTNHIMPMSIVTFSIVALTHVLLSILTNNIMPLCIMTHTR
jgi:hypothetical protein